MQIIIGNNISDFIMSYYLENWKDLTVWSYLWYFQRFLSLLVFSHQYKSDLFEVVNLENIA